MDNIYLIVKDTSTYVNEGDTSIKAIVDGYQEWIESYIKFNYNGALTNKDWWLLDSLIQYKIVKIEPLVSYRADDDICIMECIKLAPNLATFIAGYKFSELIEKLISQGANGIDATENLTIKQNVEAVLNSIKDAK